MENQHMCMKRKLILSQLGYSQQHKSVLELTLTVLDWRSPMPLTSFRSVHLTAEEVRSFLGDMHPCFLFPSWLERLIWLLIREVHPSTLRVKLRNHESQNHRIIKVGKDLWRLHSLIPLLKAESARTGYSGLCPVRFWLSPRMKSQGML